ncbi:MAG: phospholipase D-like domain-containing protein [Pseudomonadota bacterium]|nr:phospholipase D-like domain-containing protein [Pseudomonadota bacterium]
MSRLSLAALLAAVAGCAQPPAPPTVPADDEPSSHATQGNDVRLHVDGPAAHKAMFAAMAAARDHINLETYILDGGDLAERLADLLAKKVAQGVKVHVLYDGVGSVGTPRDYFKGLKKVGVGVCEFNPVEQLEKLNNRDHRKILVVDGRVAFTGGINISQAYRSSSWRARRNPGRDLKDGWRDTQVEVRGPAAAQFQRLFLDNWALQDCGPWSEARYFPPSERPGEKTVRVVKSNPDAGSEMYVALLAAIGKAKSRVWLTIGYFVPDPQLKRALLDAASRGVDVRLVLPGYSDFWAPVSAGRSHYKELMAAGVKIYEWHEALMHAKTAVIDSSWSSIGSTNLDWRSFVHNYEADVIVLDADFAREMERRFRLDMDAAVRIDPEQWRKRGLGRRFKEWLARQYEYLL